VAPGEGSPSPDSLRFLLRHPVRYLRLVPASIRLLSAGMLINYAGLYVTLFLALILAERHVSPTRIGIALTMAGAFAIFGSWLGGYLVPRLGCRLTIIVSNVGSALFTVLFIFRWPFPLTVGVVCLVAMFNRVFTPACTTLVGRLSPPGKRVQRYAILQLSLNLGISIGPPIATFLLTRSITALLLLDAGTTCCFALIALRLPSEAQVHAADPPSSTGQAPPRKLRDDRRYLTFCLGVLFVAMAYGQQTGALPLAVKDHHYNLELLGVLFTANALAVIFFQLPLTFFTRRLPLAVPLVTGGLLITGGYALLAGGTSLPLLIVSVFLWTVGEITFNPITPAVAMMMSGPGTHGSYQGALSLSRTAGQVMGPAVGVFVFSVSPSLCWLGCGMLGLASVCLFTAFAQGARTPATHIRTAAARRRTDHAPGAGAGR
jgi:MFS family permease